MTNYNPLEGVRAALQRLQSESVEPPPAAAMWNIPGQGLQSSPAEVVKRQKPDQVPRTNDSFVKARYALTILRVAQNCDQKTAARLVLGLARDAPDENELPEIAYLDLQAIATFFKLTASLADSAKLRSHPWGTAFEAANDWLRAIEARQGPRSY